MPRIQPKNFPCPHENCDKTFSGNHALENHQRTHDGLRPFTCSTEGCERTFQQKSHLTAHEKTHAEGYVQEKPFSCTWDDCDKAFTRQDQLESHMFTHTKEKPLSCPHEGCEFCCARPYELVVHDRIHSGLKPYKCDHPGCEASFAQSMHLTTHMRSHDGIRNYTCDHPGCGKKFKQHAHLATHKLIHSGVRQHVCDYEGCDKTFLQKTNLDRHKMVHDNIRPHICPDENCDAAFTQKGNLKSHIYYHHTEEGQKNRKREETRIAKLLEANGIDFKREHVVSFSCIQSTFARLDFIIIQNGVVEIIEVDENQHSHYGVECDVARMAKTYEVMTLEGNTLPVVIFRYNPHAFTVDGVTTRVLKRDREARLIERLREAFETPRPGLTIQYLYYDVVEGQNEIWNHPSYSLQDCCLPPIIA